MVSVIARLPLAGLPLRFLVLVGAALAAGLFYLLLTIPLTHLVNYIDNRLRRGKRPAQDEPVDPVTATQEMV